LTFSHFRVRDGAPNITQCSTKLLIPGWQLLLRRHEDEVHHGERRLPGPEDVQLHRPRLRHLHRATERRARSLSRRNSGKLFFSRIRDGSPPLRLHLHHHVLPAVGSVRHSLLDQLPHPDGRDTWPDGSPRDPLSGVGQHLQHGHHKHAEGRGVDGHRGLDVGLHTIRIWSPH
jgi:hypothetical protein